MTATVPLTVFRLASTNVFWTRQMQVDRTCWESESRCKESTNIKAVQNWSASTVQTSHRIQKYNRHECQVAFPTKASCRTEVAWFERLTRHKRTQIRSAVRCQTETSTATTLIELLRYHDEIWSECWAVCTAHGASSVHTLLPRSPSAYVKPLLRDSPALLHLVLVYRQRAT